MAMILPQNELRLRRDNVLMRMVTHIMKSASEDMIDVEVAQERVAPDYVGLTFKKPNVGPVSLADMTKYTFASVTSHHIRLVPNADSLDDFVTKMAAASDGATSVKKNYAQGEFQIIISYEDLITALKELGRELDMNPDNPESDLSRACKNVLADTRYLHRMTRKAQLLPI